MKRLLLVSILAMLLVACGGMEADAPDDVPQVAANESANEVVHELANPAGAVEERPDHPFDAMYIDAMIAHHTEGMQIARSVKKQGETAEIREMANAMFEAHVAEIMQLEAWRDEWYPDLAPTGGLPMDMPESARFIVRDEGIDRAFLKSMTAHHAVAYEMSMMALDQIEHAELREFAQELIDEQSAEMDEMQQMLANE